MARVGGSLLFLCFAVLSLTSCYCFAPAILSPLFVLSTAHAVDSISRFPHNHSFLPHPLQFVLFFLSWFHLSSIPYLCRFAITFNRNLLRYIERVCRPPMFPPARVFAPPPSLGLPLLAVSQVGIPLASFVFSIRWLQSERFSLMDDGIFLPSTSEESVGRIYGIRWVSWNVMIERCCGGGSCSRLGFHVSSFHSKERKKNKRDVYFFGKNIS